jgi:glyoxylase-like metal-dependent hydrolase (beta-lactamase superfamily II)
MLVNNCLISGDTLFVDGCGRTDFPYSQPEEMYISLNERLAGIKDEVVLYPGHLYSAERHAPMGEVRKNNFVLAPVSKEQWLAMFAR